LDQYFASLGANIPGAKTGPEHFEVTEQRLTQSALGGARIVRLPTNDELGRAATEWIYPTAQFPLWAVCTQHGAAQILYHHEVGCSRCGSMPHYERHAKAGREAVRFVRVCEAGHLDDVDWSGLVHSKGGCRSREFIWEGAGRALRLSTLACSKCKAEINFGKVYTKPLKCFGRRPELGFGHEESCELDARIAQRGASNLHVPVHQTALTIGETSQRLHELISDSVLRVRLEVMIEENDLNQSRVLKMLNNPAVKGRDKQSLNDKLEDTNQSRKENNKQQLLVVMHPKDIF
jgi:hypothetical protein